MASNFKFQGTDTDDLFILRSDTTLAQTPYNGLYSWGYNDDGQLGLGDIVHRSSPVQVGSLNDWTQISAGGSVGISSYFHSLAVKADGTLWSWGYNGSGQLGLDDITSRSSPVQVGSLTDWTQVSGGDSHSLAVKTDGTLWAWGNNGSGRLGDGTTVSKSSPVQIGSLTNWAQVSAGYDHSLAVKTDGTLWAWGDNSSITSGSGELGDGTVTNRSSPVQIGVLTNWARVSAGFIFSLAVKTDGTLWAWGGNGSGQLGDGTRTHRSSPVQVGSLTDWSEISASDGVTAPFSLAVKTDGTLWAWGSNGSGQLGDGTTTNRSSPVQVGSLTNWAQVSAGFDHSLAVKTDGTLWAWGSGSGGLLGDGTRTYKSSPVQVGSLTSWGQVSASGEHSLALKIF